MTDIEILAQVKKGIDLFLENTYTMEDLYGHMLQIIRENSDTGAKHKDQLERMIFKVEQLRENQRLYWGGHKNKLGECKKQEAEMDKKIFHLKGMGYDIDRFKKEQAQQKNMFPQ